MFSIVARLKNYHTDACLVLLRRREEFKIEPRLLLCHERSLLSSVQWYCTTHHSLTKTETQNDGRLLSSDLANYHTCQQE